MFLARTSDTVTRKRDTAMLRELLLTQDEGLVLPRPVMLGLPDAFCAELLELEGA